jgi:hypothetical protein
MTANNNSSRKGHESTAPDKGEVKLDTIQGSAQTVADNIRLACAESEDLSELANELWYAKIELEALVELCDGDTST